MTEPNDVPTYGAFDILIGPETWGRGQARIEDNSIELTSQETYDPRAPHIGEEMLFDLANLRTKRDGLLFASRYGLLFAPHPKPGYKESFGQWLDHARDLRGALTLYSLSNQAVSNKAKDKDAVLQTLKESLRPFRARLGPDGHEFLDRYSVKEQANIVIGEVVNAHLPQSRVAATALLYQEDEHGQWSVGTGAPPSFLWHPRFGSLLELAHFMLAAALMGRLEVRACKGCRRVFVPDPSDRLYHSSRCANAARQRNRRAHTQ